MANSYFQFKQFLIHQDRCAMKVTTDACLFGAWVAGQIKSKTNAPGNNTGNQLLDIGTGTGLLSLMLAQENTSLEIDALEIDPLAAEQATENCLNSPWHARIRVIQGDLKETRFTHPYRYIVSNPPFYENELRSPDRNKNLAHHQEGLLLKDLLEILLQNLEPDGSFYLLLPFKRKTEIMALLNQFGCHISTLVQVRQSPTHDYFRLMLEAEFRKEKNEVTTLKELIIRNEHNEYHPGFINLLQGFYLHL